MYIKVRVITKAREDKVEEISPSEFKIWTKAKPERNQANESVIALVRKHLKRYNGDIRIVSGHHSPKKILSLDDK